MESLPIEIWDIVCSYLKPGFFDTVRKLQDVLPDNHPFLRHLLYDFLPRCAPTKTIDRAHPCYKKVNPSKIVSMCGEHTGSLVQMAMREYGAVLAGGFARGDGQATDIDLFFPKHEQYAACLNAVSPLLPRDGCHMFRATGFAEIFFAEAPSIQLIVREDLFCPWEVVLDFDMSYTRCALYYHTKDDLYLACTESYLYATQTKRTAIYYKQVAGIIKRTSAERIEKAKAKGFRVLEGPMPAGGKVFQEVRHHVTALNALLAKGRADPAYLPRLWQAGFHLIQPGLPGSPKFQDYRRDDLKIYNCMARDILCDRIPMGGVTLKIRRLYKPHGEHPLSSFNAEVYKEAGHGAVATRDIKLQCKGDHVLQWRCGQVDVLDLDTSDIDFNGWWMTGWLDQTMFNESERRYRHYTIKPYDVLKGPILFTRPE